MNYFIPWILLRIVTSLFAGIFSIFRPATPLEVRIPLLPPSAPVALWLERAFVDPWMRWDAVWFEKIVSHGYSATDGTAQFHPLYPWLAIPLAKLGISPALSLLIISSVAGIGLFYSFAKLARLDLNPKDTFFALLIFSLAPPAFIIFAPYSEALFLLLAVLCLYFMRKKSWWLAGIMGGLATLTRQQGIFLIFPIGWELFENSGRNIKTLFKQWKELLSLCLVILGFVIWVLYRAIYLNDFGIKLGNIQEFIYSTIISTSAAKVVPAQQFIWPWQALYYTINKIITNPDIDIWVNIITGIFFLALLAFSWRKMRVSYRIFALMITIISFSYFTGSIHPYMGLPRHLLLGFTTFIGFASAVYKPWMRLVLIMASVVSMIFLLGLYVLRAWVP